MCIKELNIQSTLPIILPLSTIMIQNVQSCNYFNHIAHTITWLLLSSGSSCQISSLIETAKVIYGSSPGAAVVVGVHCINISTLCWSLLMQDYHQTHM